MHIGVQIMNIPTLNSNKCFPKTVLSAYFPFNQDHDLGVQGPFDTFRLSRPSFLVIGFVHLVHECGS